VHSRVSCSIQGQFGSVFTFHTHSWLVPWHCALNVSAHSGKFAVIVQVPVPEQAMPPQCSDVTAGGVPPLHWVKHSKKGRVIVSVMNNHTGERAFLSIIVGTLGHVRNGIHW
jgi:hypothetical protein